MSIPENWQTTRPTIQERTKFLLNNDRLSNVKFVVRKSNSKGKSESVTFVKKVIPAHKFVLSIGSPVFEAMFYGELAETQASIELPDCEYESLLELFRYLYSDEINLSGKKKRAARAARLLFFIQPIKSLICGVVVDVAVVKS